MAKIKVELSEAFCQKPTCNGPRHHRHHKGHEFLFVPRWAGSPEEKKRNWIKRYWEFRPGDIVYVCPRHHAEIHIIFDRLIVQHNRKKGKNLNKYSYEEAVELCGMLRAETEKWLRQKTKGVDPRRIFGRSRTKNQRRAKDGNKKKGSDNK